jgi:DNA polymerase I-like protein with 3'-5' exonuclease and polymerase domains
MNNYIYITTIEDYEKALLELSTSDIVAIDVETYVLPEYKHLRLDYGALDPHTSSVSIIAIKGLPEEIYILDIYLLEKVGYDFNKLGAFLAKCKRVIAHNAKFECKFIRVITGYMLENWWCTNVAYNLVGNAMGSKFYRAIAGYGLRNMVKDLLDIDLWGKGKEQIEDWSVRPLSANRLEYSANDVRYLHECMYILEDILTKDLPYHPSDHDYGLGMSHVVDLEMRFITVAAEMEYNGLPISSKVLNDYETYLSDKVDGVGELERVAGELAVQFNLSVEPSINNSSVLVATDKSVKALNSSVKLKEILKGQLGIKLDNAQYSVLARLLDLLKSNGEFYDEEEAKTFKEIKEWEEEIQETNSIVLKNVLKYKQLQKQESMKLSNHVHPLTKRIHFSFAQVKAATGRSSSSQPNVQNISGRVYLKIPKEVPLDGKLSKADLYTQTAWSGEQLDDHAYHRLMSRLMKDEI